MANKVEAGLELKTDADGKTSFEGVLYGSAARRCWLPDSRLFGEDYDIDKPKIDFTIKLKRPQGQYSILSDYPTKKDDKTLPDPNANPQ